MESRKYLATVNGKSTKEYALWYDMNRRCIPNGAVQIRRPSYIGCSVHPDFIKFQDFAEWCQHQIGFGSAGYDLDKDILVSGNKVYGPDTCVFVPREINILLTHNRSNKGLYPVGVNYDTKRNKFQSKLSVGGKTVSLGWFSTLNDAVDAYVNAKHKVIKQTADIWKDKLDPRVYDALMHHTIV